MPLKEFSSFYREAFDRVFAVVLAYCGNTDVAFDSTQEAFARAYSRWRRVAGADSPTAWVTTTAINVSRRQFRRRFDQGSREVAIDPAPSTERIDVMEAVRGLPDRQREAVILYYLLDLSVGQVADQMGLSEGAIKAHLFKARSSLRGVLEVRHA